MDIKPDLLCKNGLVTVMLAREFMGKRSSDRVATVGELAARFNVGRGTVQAAFKNLEGAQALFLQPKGHLGTFVARIDYEKLWNFTGLGMILGAMPLPYTKLYEGLATGLFNVLNVRKIPFSLAYVRGARPRFAALQSNRYDFAVVSALAAETALAEKMDFECCVNFGPHSYVDAHVLLFADSAQGQIKDGMRVGVDRTSIDQYLLTLEQCKGKKVQLVDLAYNQIVRKVTQGDIDAAVWNIDEILDRKLPVHYQVLGEEGRQWKDTEAVLMVNKKNYGLKNLLKSIVDRDAVLSYQKQVVDGAIIPNY